MRLGQTQAATRWPSPGRWLPDSRTPLRAEPPLSECRSRCPPPPCSVPCQDLAARRWCARPMTYICARWRSSRRGTHAAGPGGTWLSSASMRAEATSSVAITAQPWCFKISSTTRWFMATSSSSNARTGAAEAREEAVVSGLELWVMKNRVMAQPITTGLGALRACLKIGRGSVFVGKARCQGATKEDTRSGLAALANPKIPHRRTPPNFQTGS